MPFQYRIHDGRLSHSQAGWLVNGYSGLDDGDGVMEPGEGKNDPTKVGEKSIGPIPPGAYTIGPPEEGHGGFALRLTPKPGTDTLGRGGFLIHGDSVSRPGSASLGCIIVPRLIRWAIWGSGDRDLEVVP